MSKYLLCALGICAAALTGCAQTKSTLDGSAAESIKMTANKELEEAYKPVSYTHLTLPTTPYV